MKIFISPYLQIKHESCFCQIIKEDLYPKMKIRQCKTSILQGTALQINSMFSFSIYSIRWKRRRPILCLLKEIMSYYVILLTVMIRFRCHFPLWLQLWQAKRFSLFLFSHMSFFLPSVRLQDDNCRHSGRKHWTSTTSIFPSSCVVFSTPHPRTAIQLPLVIMRYLFHVFTVPETISRFC